MKLSPRHEPTTKASIAIQEAVLRVFQEHALTYAELMAILAQVMASWTKLEVRSERGQEDEDTATPAIDLGQS